MRVLIINRFFWPDESSTSMLASDLAEDLVRAGHQADVLCARVLYDRPGVRLSGVETWNGVCIHRLPSTYFGRDSMAGRISDLASFQVSLHTIGPFVVKPDITIVMTDPPVALFAGLLTRFMRGGILVHYVMDVYPEIAVRLGTLGEESLFTEALSNFYRRILKQCDRVIALGDRMGDVLVKKGVDESKLRIAPPWADGSRLAAPAREANRFRAELGLSEDDILIMYSGNMGRAHCFDEILQGVRELGSEQRAHFLFIGNGARRREIAESILQSGNPRARIMGYVPRERLAETLSAADIHLISQDPRSLGLIVPSKLAGVLAVGRPVVFVGEPRAEVACCLRDHDCGMAVSEGDGEGFAAAVRKLVRSPELRREMGKRGRKVFEAEYERQKVVGKIITDLERLHAAVG